MAAVPRYLIINAVMGLAIGASFALILLATDTFGLWSLVTASGDVTATTIIFLVSAAMTFTPFVVTTAVMLILRDSARAHPANDRQS